MQEYPADLEEGDNTEGTGFPPPERKVTTQAYDLSVQTLSEQWASGLLILPEIQREYIWDDARASRLVESLLLNIPIPVVYLAETDDAKYEIIDGHQRIRSIVRFLDNEFRLRSLLVLGEYNGLRYFELPEREQRFLRMRTLRAVIIAAESHPNMKFEIFERLNTGSIALNAQELRNSLYRGPFNRLLRRIVQDEAFRSSIGRPRPRARMVDEELVLRFLALAHRYPSYQPPLKRFLNDFMRENQDPGEDVLDEFGQFFEDTVRRVWRLLGETSFRVTDEGGSPTETVVNRALYDAQMLTIAHVTGDGAHGTGRRLRSRLGQLYQDPDFDDTIRRATGDRTRLRERVERVRDAAIDAGLDVNLPPGWD